MYVTDRHDMTLAVRVALNSNAINQSISSQAEIGRSTDLIKQKRPQAQVVECNTTEGQVSVKRGLNALSLPKVSTHISRRRLTSAETFLYI